MNEEELLPALRQALEAADAAARAIADMKPTEDTIAQMRRTLRTFEYARKTLDLLAWQSTDYTTALLEDLLYEALGVRHTLRVRNLLGRLPYDQAREIIPPAVRRLLESENEGDDYRRMAELLKHLGLDDALRDLCREAQDSIDPDVREVAEDFAVD